MEFMSGFLSQKACIGREDAILKEWISGKIGGTYIKLDEEYRSCNFQYNWF